MLLLITMKDEEAIQTLSVAYLLHNHLVYNASKEILTVTLLYENNTISIFARQLFCYF